MATKKGSKKGGAASRRGAVSRAVNVKGIVKSERDKIDKIIGEATRLLQDKSAKAPSLVALYKKAGGKNRFTVDLLKATFDSPGGYKFKSGAPPDWKRLNAALAANASDLAETRPRGGTGPSVQLGSVEPGKPTPAASVYRFSAEGTTRRMAAETGDITINCGT